MSDTKIDDGGPAFPHSHDWGWSEKTKRYEASGQPGMTLRDWFAGQALAGDMAAQNDEAGIFGNDTTDKAIQGRVAFYFRFADAMLAARKEKV